MARLALIDVTVTVSYGGLQTVIWNLAQTLRRAGHEVTIYGGIGDVTPPQALGDVRVNTFAFRSRDRVLDLGSRFQRTVERLSFARHARAAVIRESFDWIIIDKPFDFFWPWILPRNLPTRVAFVSGGTDFIPLDRFMSRRVEVMLAASYFNAWQLRTRYRKRYPVVFYNGVDVRQFAPRPGARTWRHALSVADDEILFGFAGRLVGWKGMSVAVKALAKETEHDPKLKLLIIGAGPQRRELEDLVDELGLATKVIFREPVAHDELPDWYAAIDIGVFPSIGDEAFGISIAEAMSCGKPVIGSYVGAIPEVIGNEESCGLLVAPNDVDVLAGAMRKLANNVALRESMGRAARERVTRLYTWDLAAQRLAGALGLI